MKVSEFWDLLEISNEQSQYFDETIKILSDNQKSLLINKIKDDMAEYENNFSASKGRGLAAKKKRFAELHFSSINRRISTFLDLNEKYEKQEIQRNEEFDRGMKERQTKLLELKIKNMDHKEKIVCPHCQTAGSVYMRENKEFIKTRVNSLAARVIGLGTNTERNVIEFICTNCEMDWKTDN